LLGRLKWIQSEAQVALVAKELAEARKVVADGRANEGEAHVFMSMKFIKSVFDGVWRFG